MVVESAVSGSAPESPISVQLGRGLVVDMAYIVFMLIKPFSNYLCPVDGGIVIL
jgi:hypothetical protein